MTILAMTLRNHSVENQETEQKSVMPGDFKILRSEAKTYEATQRNQHMSSLFLGCGTALLWAQDAVQVACPNCGSITPLKDFLTSPIWNYRHGGAQSKM